MRIVSLLLLLILILPTAASAETVLRVGDGIAVGADQVVAGDYYVSVGVGNTSMSGVVEGDMYAIGGSVTVNGEVRQDLSAIAGVSQLHASITDDVRLLTGEAIIAEHVGGDLFVIGNTLKILSSAEVAGNVFFFGSDATIEGSVGGSVFGTSNRMRIDGPVGGSVDVKVVHGLTLGSKAAVEGDVQYESQFDLTRAQEAVVEGAVLERPAKERTERDALRSLLLPIFITLFATLSLFLLFRREMASIVANAEGRHLKLSFVGFAVILAAPLISVLLMVTVLGFLLGAIMLVSTAFLLLTGYALASVVCGAYIGRYFNAKEPVSLLWIMIGVCVLTSIMIIPIVGPLIFVTVYAISVGMLAERLYRIFQ